MKALDIAKQLMAALPPQTDLFSDSINVVGISSAGLVASVNAIAHGLVANSLFTIVGAQTNAPIEMLVRAGTVATAKTSVNHNLTFDKIQIAETGQPLLVTIQGATEAEFNGTFELLSVPNRQHFTFKVPDAGASSATGAPVLVNGIAYNYNGTFNASVIVDADNFEFLLPVPDLPIATGNIVLKKDYRISRTVDFERALSMYTKQETQKLWLFVELNDTAASKDRHIQSDATTVLTKTTAFRQQVIFPFTIYCFVPTSNELTGAAAKDLMRDVMVMLLKSLLGKSFDSEFACGGNNTAVFVRDGMTLYDSSVYSHAFQFEAVDDISFGDSVGYDFNVAFRDIQLGFDVVFEIE